MARRRTHPGEMLLEEFMKPAGLTIGDVARLARLSPAFVHRLTIEQASVDAMTADKLARVFQTTPHFWISLQHAFDESVRE